MYSIKIESPDGRIPPIERSMSSNNVVEILPVIVELCKAEFNMLDPTALNMGNNVWRVFDIAQAWFYAKVTITEDKTE